VSLVKLCIKEGKQGTDASFTVAEITYMYAQDRQVDVVQQFMMELHRQARAEEYHHLLFSVLFEECEQKQESFL
jgi:hypothetical protein